jgi:hypothetical protein
VESSKYVKRVGIKPIPIENRFWEKVDIKKDKNLCWDWLATLRSNGYGIITSVGKEFAAHRIAFKLFYGYLDENLDVLHKCDNRKCCNPYHLRQGTKFDNMKECAERERNHNPFGYYEDHRCAKLNWHQVDRIRKIYKGKYGEQTKIAKEYGVSSETIRGIVLENTWKICKRSKIIRHKKEVKKFLDIYDNQMKIITARHKRRNLQALNMN